MGCSESKGVQQISANNAQKKLEASLKDLDVVRMSSASSSSGAGSGSEEEEYKRLVHQESQDSLGNLPTTLDNIPVSDLGESLDARRGPMTNGGSLWFTGAPTPPTSSVYGYNSKPSSSTVLSSSALSSSARSNGSSDSGIYELEDEYSHVITENSPPQLVQRVVSDFTPVENIDLTVTGKQCPRMLSGYQKARLEEQQILASLREEGFIATSKQRTGNGVAFEIIEATPQTESASSSKFKPKDFIPEETKAHLEQQRTKFQTAKDLTSKLHQAEQRRMAELEAKREKMASLAKGGDTTEKKNSELKEKQSQKTDAALEKREAHLRELRDKLKEKNKRVQQVKLKKLLNGPPVPVPVGPTSAALRHHDDFDNFFN